MVLDCIRFIFSVIGKILAFMGTVELWPGMSLLLFYCIVFIFIPVFFRVISYVKDEYIETTLENNQYERNAYASRNFRYNGKAYSISGTRFKTRFFRRRR